MVKTKSQSGVMPGVEASAMLRRIVFIILLACVPSALAGPWRAAEHNVYGWQLMSADERIEHQRRLRGFDSYLACRAYLVTHHAEMEARARRAGVVLTPRAQSACDQLRNRGRLQ